MPIYRNDRRISKILINERGLSEIYSDGSLIFTSTISPTEIVFDQSSSNPANITGFGEGEILTIMSKMRRCLVKKQGDGRVALCYLNNLDSNFYFDGSASDLTGGEGDVMVHMPAFYYQHRAIDDTHFGYAVSESAGEGDWIYVPECLVGAYKGIIEENVLYSRSGIVPTVRVSKNAFTAAAQSKGMGYDLIDYNQHCALALLFYAKYGNRNSQAILGAGGAAGGGGNVTGSSNAIGNRDTQRVGIGYASFGGVEGVHGGLYEWMSGVTISDYIYTITNPDGTIRQSIPAATVTGYITEIAASQGPYFDMVPTATGGSGTTYYSDNFSTRAGSNWILARAGTGTSVLSGVSTLWASYAATASDVVMTSRLSFRGELNVIDDVTRFKQLPLDPDTVIDTIVFNKSVSDPANITGSGGTAIDEILSRTRRCLAKKRSEGMVTIAYLDDNDSTKYADGSPADLSGAEGDVMVVKPEFHYRHRAISDTEFAYDLSVAGGSSDWILSPESLIGAYKSFADSGLLYSRSGVIPTVRISYPDSLSYAQSRGTGYGIIDFEQHCMLALLFYSKYRTRDAKSILGEGTASTSADNITGSTNNLGVSPSNPSTTGYINFQGIEGIFGGYQEWVSGVECNRLVWTITDPDGSVRTFTASNGLGNIMEIAASVGPRFDIIPTEIQSDDITYQTFYRSRYAGSGMVDRRLQRSGYGTGLTSGNNLATTLASTTPEPGTVTSVTRLSFRGDVVVAASVSEFKALPLL